MAIGGLTSQMDTSRIATGVVASLQEVSAARESFLQSRKAEDAEKTQAAVSDLAKELEALKASVAGDEDRQPRSVHRHRVRLGDAQQLLRRRDRDQPPAGAERRTGRLDCPPRRAVQADQRRHADRPPRCQARKPAGRRHPPQGRRHHPLRRGPARRGAAHPVHVPAFDHLDRRRPAGRGDGRSPEAARQCACADQCPRRRRRPGERRAAGEPVRRTAGAVHPACRNHVLRRRSQAARPGQQDTGGHRLRGQGGPDLRLQGHRRDPAGCPVPRHRLDQGRPRFGQCQRSVAPGPCGEVDDARFPLRLRRHGCRGRDARHFELSFVAGTLAASASQFPEVAEKVQLAQTEIDGYRTSFENMLKSLEAVRTSSQQLAGVTADMRGQITSRSPASRPSGPPAPAPPASGPLRSPWPASLASASPSPSSCRSPSPARRAA